MSKYFKRGNWVMRRVNKVIASICSLALVMGMPVSAAGAEQETRELPWYASLSVGDVYLVDYGEITGEEVEGVSYDVETNTLKLENYDQQGFISASQLGSDFTISLQGDNDISGIGISGGGYDYIPLDGRIVGPGTLNINRESGIGISYSDNLVIEDCTVNIEAEGAGMFYGITGSTEWYSELVIDNSNINIKGTEMEGANAGIDAQSGDLTVRNSNIDIELTGGNIFGVAAGFIDKSYNINGGRFTVENSTISCLTSTGRGDDYNHNMYFYEMPNRDELYFYAGEEGAYTEKDFDEAFELGKYYDERYDTNYNHTIISSSAIPAYCDHVWDDGTVKTPASCETKGEMTYTCTICGDTKTEEVAALGHEWGEWKELKPADCTNEGAEARTCGRCQKTQNRTIDALGHEFETTVTKDPTCTESGIQEQICTRCGFKTGETEIAPTGHQYTEWVVTKEPTFHNKGEKTRTCMVCGHVDRLEIPALSETHEHDFSGEEEVITAPNCTEEGLKKVYCTEPECGEYEMVKIPATGHTPGEWTSVKEATCSENGTEQRVCTVCGTVTDTRVTDKLPHTYGDWTVITEATCTEAGVESAECEVCHETTVRGINALGHDFVQWTVTKEATCTEDGEEQSDCTRCDASETRVIKAEGHQWSEWVITAEPTNETEGERKAVCEVCGEVKTETLPKLPDIQAPDPGNTEESNTTDSEATEGKAVKTGDNTSFLIWIALMGAAAAVFAVTKKKTNQ